jgi:hypothetical protein
MVRGHTRLHMRTIGARLDGPASLVAKARRQPGLVHAIHLSRAAGSPGRLYGCSLLSANELLGSSSTAMKCLFSVAAAAVILHAAGVARAAEEVSDPTPAQVRSAAEAFDRGREAYKTEDYVEAAEQFESADANAPSAAALELAIRARDKAGQLDRAATLAALALALCSSRRAAMRCVRAGRETAQFRNQSRLAKASRKLWSFKLQPFQLRRLPWSALTPPPTTAWPATKAASTRRARCRRRCSGSALG